MHDWSHCLLHKWKWEPFYEMVKCSAQLCCNIDTYDDFKESNKQAFMNHILRKTCIVFVRLIFNYLQTAMSL